MEYRVVKAFGWTHEQYLDTPHDALNWLMRIDQIVEQFEAEQKSG